MPNIVMHRKILSKLVLTLLCLLPVITFASPPYNKNSFPAPKEDSFTVVIDAGHGGHDVGAKGSFSYEKNVTLAIALELGKVLKENQPGVKIIFTRTKDTYPELYERAKIANRNDADLFISIHCNSTPYRRIRKVVGHRTVKRHGKTHRIPIYKTYYNHTTDASGVETYVLGLHRNGEKEKSIEDYIQKQENSSVLQEKNYKKNYNGFDPEKPESVILLALASSTYLNQSINFASKVQKQFVKLGRPSRQVRQMGLAVLAGTAMPAVLIETGFINNPEEEKYLNSDKGQKETAECIAGAIKQYREQMHRYKNDNHTETPEVISTVGEKNNPPPKANEHSGIVYKIQLLVSDHHYKPSDHIFNKLDGKVEVETIMIDNNQMYRYLLGNFSSEDDANKQLEKIKLTGFKDAYLVPYQNGKRQDK